MKSIAEFVMRGRMQALIVAVPGAGTEIFFWISAAVIALITLRKGVEQGFFILLWALLPASVLAWLHFPLALLGLLITFAMAVVLRFSTSWNTSLLAGAAGAMALAILLLFAGGAYLQQILDLYSQLFAEVFAKVPEQDPAKQILSNLQLSDLAGMFTGAAITIAVCALALARYWQAVLFNPGGFGEEFRALRFKPAIAIGLVAFAILLFSTDSLQMWAWMCLLPLLVAGIGLVHALLYRSSGATGLLIAFYVLLIMLDPLKQLLCAVALVDSFINIRALRASGGSS